ncbi:MAG: glycosyltransferase, partial [Muribaculaceae bacterium]|nr:glycosyltransferase [Muribaculaceae bacterium]
MAAERIPKVSVIAPVYGVESFIGRAVESMMAQTLDDVEFIFVDDCTPDGSVSVLRDVVVRYPERQVRILRHDVNRGLPAARNTGLDVARGEYIFHW